MTSDWQPIETAPVGDVGELAAHIDDMIAESGPTNFAGTVRLIDVNDLVLCRDTITALAAENSALRRRAPMTNDWQPIETAPEGNDTTGPFLDVLWADKTHRYLPVPARAINCYREGGTVKMVHGYPAVWTIFNPQPTHWMPLPAPPAAADTGDGL